MQKIFLLTIKRTMKYKQPIIRGENGKTSNDNSILGYKSSKNRRWINEIAASRIDWTLARVNTQIALEREE